MTEEEKMIEMYQEVHGTPTGSCYLEVVSNYGEPMVLHMMKDSYSCFEYTKADLLFDYTTKGW